MSTLWKHLYFTSTSVCCSNQTVWRKANLASKLSIDNMEKQALLNGADSAMRQRWADKVLYLSGKQWHKCERFRQEQLFVLAKYFQTEDKIFLMLSREKFLFLNLLKFFIIQLKGTQTCKSFVCLSQEDDQRGPGSDNQWHNRESYEH